MAPLREDFDPGLLVPGLGGTNISEEDGSDPSSFSVFFGAPESSLKAFGPHLTFDSRLRGNRHFLQDSGRLKV
jgi:hypothetical protein